MSNLKQLVVESSHALKAGVELSEPEVWANRAVTQGMIATILTAIVTLLKLLGIEVTIGSVDIEAIALSIALIGGFISNIFHTASNKNAAILKSKQ